MLHTLIGCVLGYYVGVTVMLQALDMPLDGVATPWRTLALAFATSVVVGIVLLVVNLLVGRAFSWTKRACYVVPPLVASALVAAGGIVGTVRFLIG